MGKGTIWGQGKTRQKVFVCIFVLVGEEVAKAQVEICSGIGGVVIVRSWRDVGHEFTAVRSYIYGERAVFNYSCFCEVILVFRTGEWGCSLLFSFVNEICIYMTN